MYSKSDIVFKKLFDSLKSGYQNNLESSMEGSKIYFWFSSIGALQMSSSNFRCDSSYIDSPDEMKKKKATISPKNEDHKCFQYIR